ncbi:MAG: RNA polymerase sigma factor [Pseudomonadota bacterium]
MALDSSGTSGGKEDAQGVLPDAVLLARYAAGDPGAARLLADRLAPRLLRAARRILGDHAEAEDVVQEAMLRLWRAAPGWRAGEAQVSTWAYRVAVNLCTDRLRRRRAVPIESVPEPEADRPPADSVLIGDARVRALGLALAALPDRQRQAVVLRHIEGLANPEIGEVMGIGVEAVESLIARGKRALVQALAGRRDELGFSE